MSQLPITYLIKDERSVVPTKAYYNDIGYDLTVIDVYKQISDNITIYETGIAVSPPDGYYLEIAPRSSLSKSGYMLANSIGIIDPSYTGTLKIALIKVDKTIEDFVLPFKCCQLILRKAENSVMIQVDSFETTDRADGCFGSTS